LPSKIDADFDLFLGSEAEFAAFLAGGAPPPTKPPFVPSLVNIQRVLISGGFDVGSRDGKPDGLMGPKTLAAIKAFQSKHGLVPDGIVGPLTTAALELEWARIA
jgi:peptidoglycan hydrolase-like protein with peptidoglycan-binding domain